MITTFVIAFREFLEAFLIVGVFLGISRKLGLKREKEIAIAAGVGIFISLALATGTYLFGSYAGTVLTEKNADALESYLLIFSGIFIAYVVFSLHEVMNRGRGRLIVSAHQQLSRESFDATLFATIVFLVVREGFEIALFTASVSLFSAFVQNFLGLLLGFAAAAALGAASFVTYIRLPFGKVFRATEYAIVLLGASLVQNGITKLLSADFGIELSRMLSFHLQFLPNEDTFVGHLLQGLLGIDQGFSGVRLGIMIVYVGVIYILFIQKRRRAQRV